MPIYKIHKFLIIDSEIELFPSTFAVDRDAGKIDLKIQVKNDEFFDLDLNNHFELMPGIYCSADCGSLISKFPFLGFDCSLRVEGLNIGENLTLSINPKYKFVTRHLIRMPVSSLFPLEHFLKLTLARLLEAQGAQLIFGAAASINDKSFLIASFGSMGKTTLLLELHKRLGDKLKILGDDTCIAYRDKLYSYPQDVRVRGKGSKFFHLEKFVSPEELFPNSIVDELAITHMFFLERSSIKKIRTLEPKDAFRQFKALQSKTLPISFERHNAGLSYISRKFQPNIPVETNYEFMSRCRFTSVKGNLENQADTIMEIIHGK